MIETQINFWFSESPLFLSIIPFGIKCSCSSKIFILLSVKLYSFTDMSSKTWRNWVKLAKNSPESPSEKCCISNCWILLSARRLNSLIQPYFNLYIENHLWGKLDVVLHRKCLWNNSGSKFDFGSCFTAIIMIKINSCCLMVRNNNKTVTVARKLWDPLGDLREALVMYAPHCPIFFIFMQFSGKMEK